ncbi:helix-turn-helix domain-containing protein [Paenibacillus alvei]|uniref:helix-turn-helix domain-containing protein n=1 Tax=Paenibacillus alvei TaxID=44250 RepID=UPI0013DCAAC0|nr:helix-turn-helix transcriptional regulator [Paenibacillus alvei]NEZ45154.1 helix-turn-helix domain-containing protein [Paenibacillus alvei]
MKENLTFTGVGERITLRMKELKLSQKDVYSATGFSKTTMSNYVNGKRLPNTTELYQLAKFLSVPMEWLLTGEGEVITTNENHGSQQSPSNISPEDIELLAKFHQLGQKEKWKLEERIEVLLELTGKKSVSSSKQMKSQVLTNGDGSEEAAAKLA